VGIGGAIYIANDGTPGGSTTVNPPAPAPTPGFTTPDGQGYTVTPSPTELPPAPSTTSPPPPAASPNPGGESQQDTNDKNIQEVGPPTPPTPQKPPDQQQASPDQQQATPDQQAPSETPQATPAAPSPGSAPQATHGNSKKSQKEQQIYVIRDKDGNVRKYGVTGQPNNSNGNPRINQQTKGTDNDGEIIGTVPAGPGARQKALDIEQQKVNDYAKQNGGQGPPDNVKPQPNN